MKAYLRAPVAARPRRMGCLVVVALVAVACDAVAPTASPAGPGESAASTAPAPQTTTTPRPTEAPLPAGLERRPAMPALINGELDPCLPLCRTGVVRPGAIPVGERYQTRWFAGGYMTLSFPEPWNINQDSTGELGMVLPEEVAKAPAGEDPYHVLFTFDIWPVKDGKRVEGEPSTAAAIEAWLRADENHRVLRAENTRIGLLPARAIDVGLSARAPMQYPDCGAPCVDGFGFEPSGGVGGIRGKDIYRFYLADVSYGGTNHLFAIEVQGRSIADLDALIPRLEAVLDTVRFPAHAAPVPATGRIVFARYSKVLDDDQVYVINADGSGERQLRTEPHQCPRAAPDGKSIALTDAPTGPLFVDLDGTTLHGTSSPDGKLTFGCGAFSPDGNRFAAETWDDTDISRGGIYLFDTADRRHLRRLTDAPDDGNDQPGSFSPDGEWLAFVRSGELWILRVDTPKDARKVAPAVADGYGVPDWSPDGRTLLASTKDGMYVVALDDRRPPMALASTSPDFKGPFAEPRWSPDGNWIEFSMRSPGPYLDVWIMRPDGSQLSRVTQHQDVDNGFGDWIP